MARILPEQKELRASKRALGGPTVGDVARVAGVSPMTVSRVINGGRAVKPATRERVEDAIANLGYVPNRAAQSLAGGRQLRIALVYSNPSAAYLSELLVGSLAQATASNASLVVELLDDSASSAQLAARLKAHRVHGALLPPPLCEDVGLLQSLHDDGIRIVQISPGSPCPYAHAVAMDDAQAARAITAHLVALGHRRIGFIEGDRALSQSGSRRVGYERALADAGIALDSSLTVAADFSYRSGMAATEQLLARSPRPTAIFASNDDMAAAAVAIAHRHGLDVPRDLSICGFDDTAMAASIWPELTTIRQPIADMARLGVKMLCEGPRASAGEDETSASRLTILPFEMIRRASDAPPRPA